MATTKDIISAVATGDLNTANDVFDQVLAAKREDAWETARMDLARTAFDSAPVEEPTAEPGTEQPGQQTTTPGAPTPPGQTPGGGTQV